MATVNVLVLRSPGANCDEETAHAFQLAGANTDQIHVNRLLDEPTTLEKYQILCVPGGFSYGDDVSAGRILGSLLEHKLGDLLKAFRDRDRLILGICNGFQVLIKSGLLDTQDDSGKLLATLAFNRHGRFETRWVHLRMRPGCCAFVTEDEILEMPIAHAEGNFVVESRSFLDSLTESGRMIATYVDNEGKSGDFPVNPNGSAGDVAGICDKTGRVFALMPHPERHVIPTQHPRWTRRGDQPTEGDGLRLFRNAVAFFG
ncbi:Phosphoribosylformylglycinamidine synthase [Planctomycetes bacterium Pan216]|uniref:Phosphoribosylformylglycinamidine synthase n=1 Tax=Kolteria novifilia TaxID=2527975 RepID=A0A518AY37_9BACT|nr:Phosphoribosylformylglycinamidine synthase [Planctomycetes bacterium Pan216]